MKQKSILYFETDSFSEENREKTISIGVDWGILFRGNRYSPHRSQCPTDWSDDHSSIWHIANQRLDDGSLQGPLPELSRTL